MNDTLVDTNVLLDVATSDPTWSYWSRTQIVYAAERGAIFVNPIIYAELAPAFATSSDLDQWLDPQTFIRAVLPYAAGWRAAEALLAYRRNGGLRTTPLPDFYIGAHAEVEGLNLIMRDAARYRTYFPKVSLITP